MARRRRAGTPQKRKYAKARCEGGTVRYNRTKGRCECRCMYTGNVIKAPMRRCRAESLAGLVVNRRRRSR